jgi:uncharacterized membrane protein YqjE
MAGPEPSIADLVRNAVRDAQELVRSEIALAKTEAREEASRYARGAALLAGAALAAAIGIVFLMAALAWAIVDLTGWPVWAGFGVVTLAMLLVAGALAYVGRNRMTARRHMPRTVDTLRENREWIRARTS